MLLTLTKKYPTLQKLAKQSLDPRIFDERIALHKSSDKNRISDYEHGVFIKVAENDSAVPSQLLNPLDVDLHRVSMVSDYLEVAASKGAVTQKVGVRGQLEKGQPDPQPGQQQVPDEVGGQERREIYPHYVHQSRNFG
jgi:hypothetical protein